MPRADTSWTRRGALQAGLAALTAPAFLGASADEGGFSFQVVETTGLRRFGYPVHLFRPDDRSWTNARLTRDSRPVPAQIRPDVGPDGRRGYSIDFNTSLGPLETETYRIEFGPRVVPGPEPAKGMKVERVGDSFRVSNGSALEFNVPANLAGLLRRASNNKLDFLGPLAEGLTLIDREGHPHRVEVVESGTALVARQGPLAVGLRFTGRTAMGDTTSVPWTVDLTFPSSKSWIEISWRVHDPDGQVAELDLDLSLKLDEGAPLVDLGASSTVYGALKKGERILLEGWPQGRSPAWLISRGVRPEAPATLAVAPFGSPPAEGWAHVMDRTRCTAIALADFGSDGSDRIVIDADGHVGLRRGSTLVGGGPMLEPTKGPKTLTAWFHFVGMPVQVGALTSPQAMLAPLKVVREPEGR